MVNYGDELNLLDLFDRFYKKHLDELAKFEKSYIEATNALSEQRKIKKNARSQKITI